MIAAGFVLFTLIYHQLSTALSQAIHYNDRKNVEDQRQLSKKLLSMKRAKDCNVTSVDTSIQSGGVWFQTYWEPCISCQNEERIGPIGDGGKWICNPVKTLKYNECHAISIGSNNHFEFEFDLIERFGCTVHVFDHTSNPPSPSICNQLCQEKIKFYKYGLGMNSKHLFLNLKDLLIMASNGANNPISTINDSSSDSSSNSNTNSNTIMKFDLFKIDCEGCEYELFHDRTNLKLLEHYIAQVLIEVHWGSKYHGSTAALTTLWNDFQVTAGFYPFHKEPNIASISLRSTVAVEYAMLNKRYVVKYEP